jgi:tRNA threonylcarbamoyl adenosine modification protein YeaZ
MDTCSANAAVAVMNDKKLIGEFVISNDRTHSQVIMPLVDEMLKKCGLDISDIDVFAVSVGPGSFTGLRIGMATVKTLAQFCKKPVIGISSLDSLYENCALFDGVVCPIIDARHDEVYNALYKDGKRITDYRVVSVDQLTQELNGQKVCFCGDGVLTYGDKLSKHKNFTVATQNISMQKASSLCIAAYKRAINNDFDDVYSLLPVYLRKSQAERELELKNNRRDD